MKNGWKRWIRGWSLIVILLSVLSVSGCSVSEEDGLQEVTEKVSQEPEVSQKDSGKSEDQEKPGQTEIRIQGVKKVQRRRSGSMYAGQSMLREFTN